MLEEIRLAIDAADPGAPAFHVDQVDGRPVRERLVQIIDRTDVRVAGILAFLARRVGDHPQNPLPGLLDRVTQVEGVAVRLAHLAPIGARYPRHAGGERLRLRKHRAVEGVESPRDLAAQLQVRKLVLAHRHQLGPVDQDVGGLQDRVTKKAVIGEVAIADLLLLLLIGGHTLQPGDGDDNRQEQVQLGMLGDMRLDEDRALLRVEPRGQPIQGHVEDVILDRRGVGILAGQSVPVADRKEAIVRLLQPDPVFQCPDQVADVHRSRRSESGQDPLARLMRRSFRGPQDVLLSMAELMIWRAAVMRLSFRPRFWIAWVSSRGGWSARVSFWTLSSSNTSCRISPGANFLKVPALTRIIPSAMSRAMA